MTTPAVHSEDDNFIIGTGDNYERLRRDARQLHLSKHNETRSKAHFARFRNAALKCSMEATYKRVEQEKSLTLRELERAQTETLKRKEKYDKKKTSSLPDISTTKTPIKSKGSRGKVNKNIIQDEQLNEKSGDEENSWMSCNAANKKDACEGNSWMSSHAPSSVDDIKRVTLNERRPTLKKNDELSISHSSVPSIKIETMSTTSDVTLNLSETSDTTKEPLQSSLRTHKTSQSGRGLYRAYSTRSVRIYPGDLKVRRSNSCDVERINREKKKSEKIYRDFDGLLKWFANYSGKEYKPSSFGGREVEEEKEVQVEEKKKALLPKCSMSPLYFRYGVPEDGVVRLC